MNLKKKPFEARVSGFLPTLTSKLQVIYARIPYVFPHFIQKSWWCWYCKSQTLQRSWGRSDRKVFCAFLLLFLLINDSGYPSQLKMLKRREGTLTTQTCAPTPMPVPRNFEMWRASQEQARPNAMKRCKNIIWYIFIPLLYYNRIKVQYDTLQYIIIRWKAN